MITGGTAKMEGAVELAEEIFHMPVRLGLPHGVKGLEDVVRNPAYSTGVGLLLHGLRKQGSATFAAAAAEDSRQPMFERLKRWVQGNF
ncbi:Cell division protein FtsA [compost metagenome]